MIPLSTEYAIREAVVLLLAAVMHPHNETFKQALAQAEGSNK